MTPSVDYRWRGKEGKGVQKEPLHWRVGVQDKEGAVTWVGGVWTDRMVEAGNQGGLCNPCWGVLVLGVVV